MSDTIKPGLEILAKSRLRKRSEGSCTDCEDIKERYKKILEEEKKQLIAFRGHGIVKNVQSPFEPFTSEEIEEIIKLAILGSRTFHFTVAKSESITYVSFDGVRIKCQIKEEAEMFVNLSF